MKVVYLMGFVVTTFVICY